jgi:glyoxylase-like metal-dependent hydrolase (beta-lactamase superfamily II)
MEGTLKVGNVEIVALSDGDIEFSTPLNEVFPSVPEDAWQEYRDRYPDVFAGPNAWRLNIGCYLLRTQGRTILVDTGLGPDANARFIGTTGILLADLKAQGVAAGDIDTVFLTHSHGDHIGWNVTGAGGRMFPNARYTMSRTEWNWVPERLAANAPGMASAERQVVSLGNLDVVDLLEGDTALTDEVTAIETPGHTPGHMSLMISSAGEKACLTGDAIVHPVQMTEPDWAPRMDFDGVASSKTRHSLLERFEAENLTIVSCHFPRPGYGQLIRVDGRRYWQAK